MKKDSLMSKVVGGLMHDAGKAPSPHKVSSKAGENGVNCPAAGAFKLNSGPSSAKQITVPTGKEKEDSIGNASCFDPNNYESSAC